MSNSKFSIFRSLLIVNSTVKQYAEHLYLMHQVALLNVKITFAISDQCGICVNNATWCKECIFSQSALLCKRNLIFNLTTHPFLFLIWLSKSKSHHGGECGDQTMNRVNSVWYIIIQIHNILYWGSVTRQISWHHSLSIYIQCKQIHQYVLLMSALVL